MISGDGSDDLPDFPVSCKLERKPENSPDECRAFFLEIIKILIRNREGEPCMFTLSCINI